MPAASPHPYLPATLPATLGPPAMSSRGSWSRSNSSTGVGSVMKKRKRGRAPGSTLPSSKSCRPNNARAAVFHNRHEAALILPDPHSGQCTTPLASMAAQAMSQRRSSSKRSSRLASWNSESKLDICIAFSTSQAVVPSLSL